MTLRIGYLQAGPAEHGICRYGRLLAQEGRRRADVIVMEENLELGRDQPGGGELIRAAAARLSAADLVHLQVSVWTDTSWGRASRALRNLRTFRRACRSPLVFTFHDVIALKGFEGERMAGVARRAAAEAIKGMLRPPVRLLRHLRRPDLPIPSPLASLWRFEGFYRWLMARWITRAGLCTFVLTAMEQRLLDSMGLAQNTVLVPHFVEDPPPSTPPSPGAPRGLKTVILAGFIFGSKGHELVVEALPLLPEITVVFVGGPRVGARDESASRLNRLAQERGVADRLRITGYLPEGEYQRHLAGADLAVCPFAPDKSASGSLSSLIAAGCPVLASDVPLIREYNAMVPDVIPTFAPYTPEALAMAVRALLALPRSEVTRGLEELRRRLSISVIYERHVESYRQALQVGSRNGSALSHSPPHR